MDAYGLTTSEAKARLAAAGPNALPTAKSETLFGLIWRVVREPILLLLIFAGSINFLLSEIADAVFLMFTVVIITGISIYQTRKSERAVLALKELTAPHAIVVRDGIEHRIPSEELVVGDLIRVREGDRVLADAELVSSSHLMLDESMLTGEPFPVGKIRGEEIFSGTLVVKGYGQAVVNKTGTDAQIGIIGQSLADIEIERTNLQREIDQIVRYVAIGSVVAAVSVLGLYGLLRGNWLEAGLASVAAAMALVPEEFPIVLTVFLALGAWRLAQVNVITRHAPVIELLGTITVLCVDKTGTITTNQMSLVNTSTEVARYGLLASPPHPVDPMDKAFGFASSLDPDLLLIREYPISESILAVTQVWESENDQLVVAAKGSPESVALLCGFTADQIAELMREVELAAQQGFRLLGVARANYPKSQTLPEEVTLFDFEFLGLAQLRDPIRPNVAQSVSELKTAGVRTIMLTGDYPGTAWAIAAEIGIQSPGGVITGAELVELTDQQLAERIKLVNVFARVAPSQKLKLIKALKADGEIVAMTGDGVNDAPALSVADVGIAMGLRGTDVAREAADLVLTNDDFNSIASGISQGRRIYDNMRKAMTYIVAVHVPIFGLALLPVLTSYWPLVLLPAQIALMEIIIDPASSVVFESEKADPEQMQRSPRPKTKRIFDRPTIGYAVTQGLMLLASSLLVYFVTINLDYEDELIRSLTFATLLIGNIFMVLSIRSRNKSMFMISNYRQNPTLKYLLIGAGLGIAVVFNFPPLQDAFNLAPIDLSGWLIVISMATSSVLWFELKKIFTKAK